MNALRNGPRLPGRCRGLPTATGSLWPLPPSTRGPRVRSEAASPAPGSAPRTPASASAGQRPGHGPSPSHAELGHRRPRGARAPGPRHSASLSPSSTCGPALGSGEGTPSARRSRRGAGTQPRPSEPPSRCGPGARTAVGYCVWPAASQMHRVPRPVTAATTPIPTPEPTRSPSLLQLGRGFRGGGHGLPLEPQTPAAEAPPETGDLACVPSARPRSPLPSGRAPPRSAKCWREADPGSRALRVNQRPPASALHALRPAPVLASGAQQASPGPRGARAACSGQKPTSWGCEPPAAKGASRPKAHASRRGGRGNAGWTRTARRPPQTPRPAVLLLPGAAFQKGWRAGLCRPGLGGRRVPRNARAGRGGRTPLPGALPLPTVQALWDPPGGKLSRPPPRTHAKPPFLPQSSQPRAPQRGSDRGPRA